MILFISGPVVVIGIGVYPGSTTADTSHEGHLEGYVVEGVEIKSVFWHVVGPPLPRTVGNYHTTVDVRGSLTAALGVPLLLPKGLMPSVGFFHEVKEKGNRVLAVSCHQDDQPHTSSTEPVRLPSTSACTASVGSRDSSTISISESVAMA